MEVLTKQELADRYYNRSKDSRLLILWQALDFMQQYNGRTKWECIALAMNVEIEE